MRGPKTSCILQRPVQSRGSSGGIDNDWHRVVSFNAVFSDLTAYEDNIFNRETVVATHKLRVPANAIPYPVRDQIKAKNRIVIDDEEYDITGVRATRRGRGIVRSYRLTLRRIE